jgi:acetyl-CoA carboxylase carboxyl transferase subunit beta
MNWITNYVRPKIRALVSKPEIPDHLWDKCPSCGQMIFHRELENSLKVCTSCNYHMRISASERMDILFDEASYTKIELPEAVADPLRFRDRERYSDRLRKARSKTGQNDAIQVAHGTIGGQPVVMAVFDFSFMGGSMGIAVGEGVIAAAKLAVAQEAALIAVPASGGARMQEGMLSLMQLPRSVIAVEMVKDRKLPYIVLLTDPTTGGVSASFAMLGDIQIAEPGAIIGFAGARVIEETIRETLPEGFQRAEYLLEHGMIDMVVPRKELRPTIARILTLLREKTPVAEVVPLSKAARKKKKADGELPAEEAEELSAKAEPAAEEGEAERDAKK